MLVCTITCDLQIYPLQSCNTPTRILTIGALNVLETYPGNVTSKKGYIVALLCERKLSPSNHRGRQSTLAYENAAGLKVAYFCIRWKMKNLLHRRILKVILSKVGYLTKYKGSVGKWQLNPLKSNQNVPTWA